MPPPFTARLLPCLLGLVLLGLPSSRAQGTVPAGTERASQVARCLKLRRDAPPWRPRWPNRCCARPT